MSKSTKQQIVIQIYYFHNIYIYIYILYINLLMKFNMQLLSLYNSYEILINK